MPVRWQVPGKARASMLGVSWRDVGSQDKPVNPSVLKGSFEDIQELFFAGRLPSRRLVVLGQAGAGKSMLAIRLARNLLSGRRAGDRVPIVVTVATWQPRTETLLDFASGQLIRDHPGLGSVVSATDGQQPTIAFGLAATGKLMLILDGLDEIPATLRADALRRISDLGSDAPLVVTSRTAEYELAVEELGRGLPRAAVVEVLPLTPGEIKKYLTEATAPPASRWKPVFDHLAQHRTSDLAKVMQTPLMIWLARTIYATRDSTPGEIVPLAVSGGPAAIENHLMSKLVSAAFTPGEYSTAAAIRWNAESAEGWLRFIAQHLKQEETPDFAWWDLNRCAPRIVHGIVGGVPIAIPIALVVGVVAGITKNPLAGLIDGVVAGSGVGLLAGLPGGLSSWRKMAPSRVELHVRDNIGRLTTRLVLGLLFGFGFGALIGLPIIFLYGPAYGLLVALALGPAIGFALTLRQLFNVSSDVSTAVSPASILHDDMMSAIVQASMGGIGLAVGAVIALLVIVRFGIATGIGIGVAYGLVYGITFGFGIRASRINTPAFTTFMIARAWLAAHRRLPWSLMPFLEDAHKIGVLRQQGAVYQFRHATLQDYLATYEVKGKR